MLLEMGNIYLKDVKFGSKTGIVDGKFTINKKELSDYLKQQDARLRTVKAHLVKPGESTRIICVKDALEARVKVNGDKRGEGRMHAVKNMAVITCGQIVAYQEGIVDMSGSGAAYSPFSEIHNVALEIDVVSGLSQHEHEEAVRYAGLRTSDYLGQFARDIKPDEIIAYDTGKSVSSNLPRIVYVYMVLTQGLMHDTYHWMGESWCNATEEMPRIVQPQFVLDNGIHSGNCVSACDKNTTWHHQNNPVIYKFMSEHGKTKNFVGVVLTNEPTKLAAKEASAAGAVKLARKLKADGVIITEEGFGNPEADLMMIVRGLEQAGIKTVLITDEYAGSDGASQSLADTTPEADAVVSAGNANEIIELPPMKKIIGPIKDLTKLAGAYPQSLKKDGSLVIELQGIVGATNQLGERTLSCREV